MSPLLCRILLVDHAGRRPLWEAQLAGTSSRTLTPLDPRPFAPWDVSALAAVYQVGEGPSLLTDTLPLMSRLQLCKCRFCFSRDQDHVLAILEKRERTPVDVAAMAGEIETLVQAVPTASDVETPLLRPKSDADINLSDRLEWRVQEPVILPEGARLLVLVDDDAMVRSVCTRILQPQFLVFEVPGSLDALALSDRLPCPVPMLVSDITLPHMDGVTLAHRWRQRRPESRVLLLSGNPHTGALPPEIGFLQKPFLQDEMLRAVHQLVDAGEKVGAH